MELKLKELNGKSARFKEDLDTLMRRGCEWLRPWLKSDPDLSEEDRCICDDILAGVK